MDLGSLGKFVLNTINHNSQSGMEPWPLYLSPFKGHRLGIAPLCSGADKGRLLSNSVVLREVYPRLLTFCSTLAFSLWFNYLLTQVHLVWSFLNVRASVLKCEPSLAFATAQVNANCNKGASKTHCGCGFAPAPASCLSVFPGSCVRALMP